MPTHKRARPDAARDAGDRLKLHRRRMHADGRDYTVITLRPDAGARFSTNRYHDTWHVLSDVYGARLMGRLLWGLSFQRRPGTLIVIDRQHLTPNPFDAAPADPVMLVSAHLTTLTPRAARRLVAPLPSEGTVRWHTWGLDAEVARLRGPAAWDWEPLADTRGAAVERVGGALVLRAPPTRLREWAANVARLGDDLHGRMDYVALQTTRYWSSWAIDGEMQIFSDYRQRVAVARVARREVLAGLPAPRVPAEVEPIIWEHAGAVRSRRHPAVASRRSGA
ncbi:hypothetical protein [Sinosporangium siamense]|uniref:Uncharacterized protein n=1 Tax=Sinosporangium siamense TaxID=1367973 RepID=A0A919V337_9ACTN|nr:hypothetical protein [Sinosporangium siamense]GII90570.1 hypothetical protein Ssi02_08010 [Sinosporangium siamense]